MMVLSDDPSEDLLSLKSLAEDISNRIESSLHCLSTHKAKPSVAAALKDIDNTLSIARSRLREVYNSTLSVNRLPPEILTTIFKFLSPSRELPPTPTSHLPPPFSDATHIKLWVRQMTHICRYWRNAAFGTSLLWGSIIFGSGELLDDDNLPYTSLRRAHNSPLDITIHPAADSGIQNAWTYLTPLAERFRQLHIRNIPLAVLDTWSSPLENVAVPMLETLRIRALSPRMLREGSNFPRLPQLFKGYTPKLKHLDISGYTVWANRFHNLTTLRLSYQSYTLGDLTHFFALLQTSLSLERLMCSHCEFRRETIPHPQPSASPLERRFVPLHNLRQLTLLDSEAEFMSEVLSRLDVPSKNILILCGGCYPSARSMNTVFPRKEQSRIRAFDCVTSLHIQLSLEAGLARVNATGPSNAIQLLFNYVCYASMDVPIGLPEIFPFRALRELKLSGFDYYNDAAVWSTVFLCMPLLSTLVLHLFPGKADTWLNALAPVWSNGERRCPAHNLTNLYIYPPVHEALSATVSATRQRHEVLGHSLKRLFIMLPCDEEPEEYTVVYQTAFWSWKRNHEELKTAIEEVIFEEGDGYHVQDAPEVVRPYMFQAQLDTWS
ncbi:hypothetical protein BDY19DRAFT_101880 [Irpex rosettiformis]|uniref:Uncharacterized protein n=1 Tax=Irpex rosettiformis TaxID=378272 RepID=A0ACB8U4U4_9APHY|nr:hypothetical protein BDY19DRAFT_101880 [Irpex rosettiformis]